MQKKNDAHEDIDFIALPNLYRLYDQFEKQYLNRTDFNVLLLNRCCTYKTFYL